MKVFKQASFKKVFCIAHQERMFIYKFRTTKIKPTHHGILYIVWHQDAIYFTFSMLWHFITSWKTVLASSVFPCIRKLIPRLFWRLVSSGNFWTKNRKVLVALPLHPKSQEKECILFSFKRPMFFIVFTSLTVDKTLTENNIKFEYF